MITLLIGLAAAFLSEHYHTPVMLFSLLLGMAFNYLSDDPKMAPGLEFASTSILRLGVALLAARITISQLTTLGWQPLAIVFVMVVSVLLLGVVLGRVFKLPHQLGLLTGGAVAICGASATIAITAALPKKYRNDKAVALTIIGITVLSSLAMIIYPLIAAVLGLDSNQAGFFLGASIHDVAQVVGAGYSVSHEAGDVATIIKLFRVALLVPIVCAVAILMRDKKNGIESGPMFPPFLIAFVLIVLANSANWIPPMVIDVVNEVSRWTLVFAIGAIGTRTALRDISKLGFAPLMLLLTETVVLLLASVVVAMWV